MNLMAVSDDVDRVAPGCPRLTAGMASLPGKTATTVHAVDRDGADVSEVLVELLATRWPEVRARLLAQHTHDGQGRCRGCRVPGYGTPGGHWPCLLALVAEQAENAVRGK
jgi:hypothetical protein